MMGCVLSGAPTTMPSTSHIVSLYRFPVKSNLSLYKDVLMPKRNIRDDLSNFFDYNVYLPTNTIYLGDVDEDGVSPSLAAYIIKALHVLDTSSDKPINIKLNNMGGCKYHGMAIYDAIRLCKNTVDITVVGTAMSMASIILQAADHRSISKNSRIMIHYGTWNHDGHPKEFKNWAKESEKYHHMMEQIYMDRILVKNPKYKLATLKAMLDFDTIISASEALDLGLVDEVV